jgi:asparagine synthase (glutamine-hydrolysing)
MTDIQGHRGPDDRGVWERQFLDGTWVGLGSRRLAILDLSAAGHMPMGNEAGTIWITYNGEVYNFQELRRELIAEGCSFRSNTDTEVILRLYEKEGPECVKRLNGMFALAVCDGRQPNRPIVFLARDHFGVKPLYYIHSGRRLAFASEAKALLELSDVPRKVDLQALNQYLNFLWVPDPGTLFSGIFKLLPGHYALFQDGELRITRYWDLEFPKAGADYPTSEEDLIAELRERFRRSVQGQMISDVPIGAFLSAGLDSSGIVAMMAQAANGPVRTFTITFPPGKRKGETTMDDPILSQSHFR